MEKVLGLILAGRLVDISLGKELGRRSAPLAGRTRRDERLFWSLIKQQHSM
jgi:hypothetical protein